MNEMLDHIRDPTANPGAVKEIIRMRGHRRSGQEGKWEVMENKVAARSEEGTPLVARAGAVATVRLRRPSRRNMLRDEDLQTLLALLADLDADESVRVVVLAADTREQKRPVFCAGYQLAGFDQDKHDPRLFENVANALEALRPITICALSGSVYGGATDLVLSCDLCIAAAGSEWSMPAATLGLHYYPEGLRRYVSRLGLATAKRAFLGGRPLPVEELAHTGAFDQIIPAEHFDAQLDAMVTRVAALAPLAAGGMKRSLNELGAGLFDVPRIREREARTLASSDFLEGRTAMAEKRKPLFRGR